MAWRTLAAGTMRAAAACRVRGRAGLRRRSGVAPLRAAPAQTPHSGYHFDGSPRRFFEGWYFKVALPDAPGAQLAWMYSVELPAGGAGAGVGAQVMGPQDGYLCTHAREVGGFRASQRHLSLRHAFGPAAENAWFDASATRHSGSLAARQDTAGPGPESTVGTCRWDYVTRPVSGWGGDAGATQRSTAGWLAAVPVFEPHWQVLMSHGLSTGWVEWGGERFDFVDAPTYAEKNWGGAFPRKWFWAQCNSFDGEPGLALTAGGGTRDLPLFGSAEDVAMLGVHYGGRFYSVVPWEGRVSWSVAPWGRWSIRGVSDDGTEIELEAQCDAGAGTALRAPTAEGLREVCRDTFQGRATLTVRSGGREVVRATTSSAALETGGGPWDGDWDAQAAMAEPLRSVLASTAGLEEPVARIPEPIRPPGL